jgi:hypothetical protein
VGPASAKQPPVPDEAIIAPASMAKSVRAIGDRLLEALHEAYREAADST